MLAVGKHVIADAYNIETEIFNKLSVKNYHIFDEFITDVLTKNNMTLLKKTINHFDENGAVTALYLLAESHFSLHTWPEKNYIAFDAFTCGDCDTEKLINDVLMYIGKKDDTIKSDVNIMVIKRGDKTRFYI